MPKIPPVFFLTIALSLSASGVGEYPIQEVEDRTNLPLLNPDLASRKTAKFRLVNGLEVILISDPSADQSAAAMAVEAGSWNDPKEYPGMAHFCEHMLFMGSRSYPEENEFMKLVGDSQGQTNAFTAADRTVYMFSSKTEGFLPILDRFAHFFIDPLFNPSGISRELHAVDQEFAKNLEHDGWREHMVFKELGNPDHPHRGFHIGNSETLKGIPEQALKKWHAKYYGANRMHLAIYSPAPVEELKKEIAAHFSDIPITAYQPLLPEGTLSSEQQRGHITYIQPIRQRSSLSLTWELPPELSDDLSQSAELLAYALNRGQKYSLYEDLKAEELIDGISIYTANPGDKDHRFFEISMELTEKGLAQWEQAALRCFEALSTYRAAGGVPPYLYEEKNTLAKLFYQYQSREDAFHFTMNIGQGMLDEPLDTYPRHQILAAHFDPGKIERLFSLLTPQSCLFTLLAPPEATGISLDKKERWFGAEYTVRELSPEWLALWTDAAPSHTIRLPTPNPFVPKKLLLVPTDFPSMPQKMAESAFGLAYYCRAPEFKTPEAVIELHIRSPLFTPEAKSTCLGALYLDHLTDQIQPLLASAKSAGLATRFSYEKGKLSIEISGFSEKAPLLLQKILEQLSSSPPTPGQFQIYLARHKKGYLNSQKELAVYQGKDLLDSLLIYGKSTAVQKLEALQAISYEDFLGFYNQLFEQTYMEGFFGGNLSLKDAESAWLDVQHILARTPYAKESHPKRKVLSLPEQGGPFFLVQPVEAQGNAAWLLIDQGPFSLEQRAGQEILASALQEAFFDTLRTKQKTGYLASSSALAPDEMRLFQTFVVQSNSHQPEDLLYRFELFLETFLEDLETNISEDRFAMIQANMIHSLQTRYRNLQEKIALWDYLAFEQKGNFRFIEERIEGLEQLSYEQFLRVARESLGRSNHKRLAILSEGKLPNPFAYELVAPEEIPEIAKYTDRDSKIGQ